MTDKNAQALEALKRVCTHTPRTSAQIDADWNHARSVIAALESAAPSAAEPVATPAHSDKNAAFADWMLHGIEISGEAVDGFKLNAAVRDVLVERQRQISIEGWTSEHDDEHDTGEMASAGAAYAYASPMAGDASVEHGPDDPPEFWPWDEAWWKPSDSRRMLVKAAALILAEIERLDRAAGAAAPPAPSATSAEPTGDRGLADRLYKAEGQVNNLTDKLRSANNCISEWVNYGAKIADALGVKILSPDLHLREIARLRATLHAVQPEAETSAEKATAICLAVAELPDRSSPADWPEAMLVTHDELRAIVLDQLASPLRADAPVAEPVAPYAYAIHDVYGNLIAIKLWDPEEAPWDDGCCGEYWGGNTKLYTRPPAPEEGKDAARKPLSLLQQYDREQQPGYRDGYEDGRLKGFDVGLRHGKDQASARKPLTDAQIEAGRRATFSTDNPFCPCDRKTMLKAVHWAEKAHGITDAAMAQGERK